MSEEIMQVASRIKELREISGYSRHAVAKLVGVDYETYKGYEENGTDIPISVLYKLANEFGVDFTEILTGKSPKLDTYCVVRKDKGINIDRYPGYHFESLAYKFMHKMMEPLMVTVQPDDKDHKLVVHEGQEFNYVVEGTVMVEFGDESVVLEAGDSIYFDPTLPHGQKAMNGKPAKFLTVIAQ
ncbi:MAG TPA: cupin domain-containing protein [Candidatus Aphodoplasma excrementigallinarum]|uniref:Cupin domain-containing protein n=1 Tax=Candidatus Aphodoplasma excrementigallinarum TaxID=2840673 RepID=A0A9D1NFI3_9FIRM|nr:cupin domain-containing protein [Candidatus Aphodoplasma excrementigallinarum]